MSDEQAQPDEGEVVDGTATEIAEPERSNRGPSADIVPITSREVLRPLDGDALVASFEEYQQLRGRLLDGSDYQSAGGDKRFVKKSGWRKIATAFGLSVIRVDETVDRDDAGQPVRAKAIYRAIAPNGRSMDGDGYCSVDEDRFSGPRGNKAKLENDLRATATTRAKNRAISDLVGMGEVSAEEVDGGAGSGAPKVVEATAELKQKAEDAIAYLGGHNAVLLATKIVAANDGKLPAAVATALVYVEAAQRAAAGQAAA